MSPRIFVIVCGGAAIARVLASCADSEEPSAAVLLDAGPQPDSAVKIPPPDAGAPKLACKSGGFCVVAIPPDPVSLNGIWGSSASDVWIVGSPDLTLHWDGIKLASGKAQTKQTLFGVWGSGKDDVWTFSSGNAMWHSTGFVDGGPAWSAYDAGDAGPAWSGPVLGMWGRAPDDVWTVGVFSLADTLPPVWHCDGWRAGAPRWQGAATGTPSDQPDPHTFNAIWGSAAGDVWIVGLDGKTRHAERTSDGGTTWSGVNSQTSTNLNAVWGSGKGEVWAAGEGGTMRRFNRNASGGIDVTMFDTPTTATLYAIAGFGPDDVWAAGAGGTLLHWNGSAWTLENVAIPNKADADLYSAWTSSSGDLWIGGRSTLLYKGTAPVPEQSGTPPVPGQSK